jgi:hypothetical protein
MKAKHYIYRNLHTGNFSVKFRGRVVSHLEVCIAKDVEFKVSVKGRERVRKEKRKNVHATIACNSVVNTSRLDLNNYDEIYYNPYTTDTFIDKEGAPIYRAEEVLCQDNKIYIKKHTKEK